MRKAVVRFTENVQLTLGLIAGIGVAVLSRYLLEAKYIEPLGDLPATSVGYAISAWLVLWALRSAGVVITVTPTALTRKSLFGEYRIAWSEMEWLEVGPSCLWLVFHGGGKRIWMRRPATSMESWFRGDMDEDHEDAALSHLMAMVDAHGIPSETGFLTPFKTSRA